MMHTPERSPERDAAIDLILPNVPFDGWTLKALRAGLRSAGLPEADAELLFPGGAADMIATFCDLGDRRMEEGAAALDLASMRTPERVRALIELRLRQNRPHREAIRRALGVLALPRNAELRPPAPPGRLTRFGTPRATARLISVGIQSARSWLAFIPARSCSG